MSDLWVVNASPIITLAKAGYLHLLDQLAAVLDDAAARRCARTLGVPILGTLAVVLRAKQAGLISSASQVAAALVRAGLRLDDETLRKALERGAAEPWPPQH